MVKVQNKVTLESGGVGYLKWGGFLLVRGGDSKVTVL